MPAQPDDTLFGSEGLTIGTEPVSGLPASAHNPVAIDAALAGFGYAWLADLLPAPQAPACERCRTPMRLPAFAPVLWACPACYPKEAA